MRQLRDHNERVIARCAKRAPRGLWAMSAIGLGVGMVRLHLQLGGAVPLVAGAIGLAFLWFLADRVLWKHRTMTKDPLFRLLLEQPELFVAVKHSRGWSTDAFRVFTADGRVVELIARGTLSRRLAVSLAAHCSGADVSTPWVSRSQPWRPVPAPAAGGLPFA